MAKHKLFAEEEFEFDLLGICSNNSDYRLCWNINQCLGINLSKTDDYAVMSKKEGESLHSFYHYTDESDYTEYYLIKNLSNTFKHLIPEKAQVDYFLVLKNNSVHDPDDILDLLKENETILTAFIFDPAELKSKSNLIF